MRLPPLALALVPSMAPVLGPAVCEFNGATVGNIDSSGDSTVAAADDDDDDDDGEGEGSGEMALTDTGDDDGVAQLPWSTPITPPPPPPPPPAAAAPPDTATPPAAAAL